MQALYHKSVDDRVFQILDLLVQDHDFFIRGDQLPLCLLGLFFRFLRLGVGLFSAFLLIDDGSTDGSGRICDELAAKDARVRVIHQPNGGVSKARNRGLQEATGDFIVFGDSDDWVDANLLEWLLAKQKASGADVVCHAYARELKEGTEYPSKALPKTFMTADEYIAGSLGESSGMILSACLALYPAEAAKALRFREDLPYGEDSLYLCTLLSRISSVYYEPEALYHYRVIREGNTLGTTSLAKLELSEYHALVSPVASPKRERL